jgi:5-methylthioadenosine/S-adenosylhomocysteine deaminase
MRQFESNLVRAGVSPHAPYTVSGSQLEMISRLAIDEKLPLMIHAAESEAEKLFMLEGRGPFAEGLRHRGIQWQAPGISTIEYLSRRGILETGPLLAHCITVDDNDLELIKQTGAGIAHCPKSNAKLGHGRAPYSEFVEREIRVGLGSDSVASNNTCDILEEARFATLIARLRPDFEDPVSAEQSLFAATLGGARALGLDDQIGALTEGMQADIVVVGLDGSHQQPVRAPADALIFSSSGRDVLMTLVAGREIYSDEEVRCADETEYRMRIETARTKIEKEF